MFIIGTAGHIDHGKSSVIIRLTGINPDRLPEEKSRGMTIDLGFAYYDTDSGQRVGIVDVPGHERFVRNMIAGAGGIDAVLMIVAADDGWMPQSQEHLQIIRLLGIKYGLIILTKIDLAETSWADLVADDIRQKVKGTFLEDAPIIRVSSETGEGFERLKKEIESLASNIISREDIAKPRLYADRSFIIQGIGGIVTGTLRGGSLSVGQEVAVFPSRMKGKVRSIQSHNIDVQKAEPGQRTATGFTGIDKKYLERGSVVSLPGIVEKYPEKPVFALHLEMVGESPIIVEDRRKLLMVLGTTETEGEVRLFSETPLTPGQSGIVFFKPFEPVMGFVGDHFIVRLPTPAETVGGGRILDIIDDFPRKKDWPEFEYLNRREKLELAGLIESELRKKKFVKLPDDFLFSCFEDEVISEYIQKISVEGRLESFAGAYYDKEAISALNSTVLKAMKGKFREAPHLDGLPIDEIQAAVDLSPAELNMVLEYASAKEEIVKKGNRYDLAGRGLDIKGGLKKAADQIEADLLKDMYSPPRLSEIVGIGKEFSDAVNYLLKAGIAVKADADIVFHRQAWDKIVGEIKSLFDKNGKFMVGDLRDRLGTTRKYIVPILEETDRLKITRRDGDYRVKGENYDKA